MTKNDLMRYRAIVREITDIDNRLEKLYAKEIPVVCGKVKGSSRDFPYTEVRTSVLMESPLEAHRRDILVRDLERKKESLYEKQLEIESFIDGVEDSTDRTIFRLTYYDGLKQEEVAKNIGLERSSVSKKISKYLQLSHNSQK